MKALRNALPASVRIGILCKFGASELRRPVLVTVWWNVARILLSLSTQESRPSPYVDLSFSTSR